MKKKRLQCNGYLTRASKVCLITSYLSPSFLTFTITSPSHLLINKAASIDCSVMDATKSGDEEEEDEEPMAKKVREVVKVIFL